MGILGGWIFRMEVRSMTTAFLFLVGGAVTFLLFAVLGAICDWIDRCEMR